MRRRKLTFLQTWVAYQQSLYIYIYIEWMNELEPQWEFCCEATRETVNDRPCNVKNINNQNKKRKKYLLQLYSCVHTASQNVQLLLTSYMDHKYAQVNHLDHAKPFFAECNFRKTIPHIFGNDAENPITHQ